MNTLRLTAAQAMVRYLACQFVSDARQTVRYFSGVWAIFGHGNVAGLGEALSTVREVLPTFRAHNEQGMAHAAIAFAKQMRRRRAMVCTTSIGPGATNLVTAAALAHVNRLPVLLLPGDVYASRRPDPVLQQVEDFAAGTVSANDCLKPVSRYFDRITRPEQLLDALPRAMATLLDPASCGPVTVAFCQDVQAEAFDFPVCFFAPRTWSVRAPHPDPVELDQLACLLRNAQAPLIIAGGGVAYASTGTEAALADFALRSGIPVAQTQAGKGSLAWDHSLNVGAIGVTGSSAANTTAAQADLVIGLGTRLQDFTTGSRALFNGPQCKLVQVNICSYDAHKHDAVSVVADVGATIADLSALLGDWRAPAVWTQAATARIAEWNDVWEKATAPAGNGLPSDAQVLGAVWRNAAQDAIVVCAAGGLPGELHKLWRTRSPGGYHVEYGYSCMGYEIAGGLGVKMAEPARDVYVLVGDGSYLMMNSELATSVMLGLKLIVTVLDNRGFGCINRLQKSTGAEPFNNLLADSLHVNLPRIDFAAHAASLGARAQKVANLLELEAALQDARTADRTSVIVIETDPDSTTLAGGAWWDVAVPEVSDSEAVAQARAAYEAKMKATAGGLMAIRFGVSPIAWINDDMPELGGDTPLETVLSDASEVGFHGVELGGKFPREPRALRRLLDEHGLDLVGGWYSGALLTRSAQAEIAALQPHLALLKALGSSVFVFAETSNAIHGDRRRPLVDTPRLESAGWTSFGAALTEVADYIQAQGLRFAYHHHLGTVVENARDIDAFLKSTGGSVGLTVDTGHAALAGIDSVALIRSHPSRVAHVHCKDVRQGVFERVISSGGSFLDGVLAGMFTVPGDGGLDYGAVMQALAAIDYSGWIIVEAEQDPASADPRRYAELGLATLQQTASEADLLEDGG